MMIENKETTQGMQKKSKSQSVCHI